VKIFGLTRDVRISTYLTTPSESLITPSFHLWDILRISADAVWTVKVCHERCCSAREQSGNHSESVTYCFERSSLVHSQRKQSRANNTLNKHFILQLNVKCDYVTTQRLTLPPVSIKYFSLRLWHYLRWAYREARRYGTENEKYIK
jgi:hypothetical protein